MTPSQPARDVERQSVPTPPDAVMDGLDDRAVTAARAEHGANALTSKGGWPLLGTLKDVILEPMFMLLLAASAVYVAVGQITEALTLSVALLLVAGISVYQSLRSDRALAALSTLTQPNARVWRNGGLTTIPTDQIVVGDAVLVAEGERVPADGTLLASNDFSVDEAVLTGESVSVTKPIGATVFAGTNAASGSATLRITAVGARTELGRIGQRVAEIKPEKSPLQRQINRFVVSMAWIGVGAFALVWGINFARTGNWLTALLFGLTLAMSILPEEIPVAFSSFMALGAARLSRMGVLTKKPQTVESLGSATVICTDKTGTITQTGMTVRQIYNGATAQLEPLPGVLSDSAAQVLETARWASEDAPFDAMEQAIVAAYTQLKSIATDAAMIHEYPLDGTPPMMTHVRKTASGETVVAGKGALEHILNVCSLEPAVADGIREVAKRLSTQGYRVLGVAKGATPSSAFPTTQDEFEWSFLGLVALENPPKANARAVVQAFTDAGIRVKIITGDNLETAQAIARQVGLPGADTYQTGQQIMAMDAATLEGQVKQTAVFARMFPEAKLRVVEALKRTGEVVAMTGDGVNDAPALKAAHIGVSMGQRGTEVAKQAASLVLVNDDLGSMVDAIAQGRRIYQNLKKAVAYIVSIHIPIILTVAVPLIFDWRIANLFAPIHVIFLELVMGPTCSIAFENEPAEANQMRQAPRPTNASFLAGADLTRSIAQGLGIALAVLGVYFVTMQRGDSAAVMRTLVFSTLVICNILLTLTNRSMTQSVIQTLGVPNRWLWLMIAATFGLLLATLLLEPARQLFGFAPVSLLELSWCVLAALIGVGWIEGYKAIVRRSIA